ncbi:MAG: MBL fold metallo-hydrolase, partial [Chloroflexi bacterium]|nr:MBL fold metallo-hydrolase [Chloroflexota bacterium]
LGAVDVLFLPVGGFFTIDPAQANRICQQLSPKVVIPMHYKTPKCGFPIAPVDDFLKGRPRVKRLSASEVQLDRNSLPKEQETLVLQYAL